MLIDETYQKALSGLKNNVGSYGLIAATNEPGLEKASYASLFPRDIGISTLGMLASGEPNLISAAKLSLITLCECQSPRGQFPQNYAPDTKKIHWWMPGGIDGTLWWAISFLEYCKKTNDQEFYKTYLPNLEKALTWLMYQDTNNDSLLEQGEACDWADEFPRMGTVLYSNSLWYWLTKLCVEVCEKEEFRKISEDVHLGINTLLWIYKSQDRNMNYMPENEYTKKNIYAQNMIEIASAKAVYLPYYLGHMSHKTFEMRCDVFANILACFAGVASAEQTKLFVDFVFRSGINTPYPVKVLYPPIYPGEPDWKEYMAKGRQNFPWQYHNGGIWPFVGGFWVMLLAKLNHPEAKNELEKLAKANELYNFEFNEYLHGEYGTPLGVPHQSWSMAMYVAAYKAVTSA